MSSRRRFYKRPTAEAPIQCARLSVTKPPSNLVSSWSDLSVLSAASEFTSSRLLCWARTCTRRSESRRRRRQLTPVSDCNSAGAASGGTLTLRSKSYRQTESCSMDLSSIASGSIMPQSTMSCSTRGRSAKRCLLLTRSRYREQAKSQSEVQSNACIVLHNLPRAGSRAVWV